MTRRSTALLLALALAFALGAPAAMAEGDGAEDAAVYAQQGGETTAAAETEAAEESDPAEAESPAADAEGTVSLGNLRARMLESYYPLMALGENIKSIEEFDYERQAEDLRNKMSDIAEQQWAMFQLPLGIGDVMNMSLQAQYDAYKEALDDVRKGKLREDNESIERQLLNLREQMVVVGETLYITIKGLEAQDATLTRTVAALRRSEQEIALREQLGQVSELTASQVSAGRAQAESGQRTLRMGMGNVLLQLKAMTGTGLDDALSLAPLPAVTAEQLAGMDLAADLEKAKAASYELYDAKKTYDDAKKDYDDVIKKYGFSSPKNEVMSAKHTWQAAQYTYENALLDYELRFRALFAQVKDAAQVLGAKRSALALEEKNYAVSALKYEQGNISANALADAKDSLADAKDGVAGAERDLFSQYRSYYWAVEYGILNS